MTNNSAWRRFALRLGTERDAAVPSWDGCGACAVWRPAFEVWCPACEVWCPACEVQCPIDDDLIKVAAWSVRHGRARWTSVRATRVAPMDADIRMLVEKLTPAQALDIVECPPLLSRFIDESGVMRPGKLISALWQRAEGADEGPGPGDPRRTDAERLREFVQTAARLPRRLRQVASLCLDHGLSLTECANRARHLAEYGPVTLLAAATARARNESSQRARRGRRDRGGRRERGGVRFSRRGTRGSGLAGA